jgi:hypothetical protein
MKICKNAVAVNATISAHKCILTFFNKHNPFLRLNIKVVKCYSNCKLLNLYSIHDYILSQNFHMSIGLLKIITIIVKNIFYYFLFLGNINIRYFLTNSLLKVIYRYITQIKYPHLSMLLSFVHEKNRVSITLLNHSVV